MIDITALTESDKGREVRYRTHGSMEYGRITSWNDYYVFVRYHLRIDGKGQTPRTGETSEATAPTELEFTS